MESRSSYQRNVDRFYYLSAWRRLAHVTQVTSANGKRSQHNRLTHTLKVAQVGRRLAEFLLIQKPELEDVLDPDVVTAAGLAHDLGHPPFGHNGEKELNSIANEYGIDGFEGNAQSFRILTRLTSHIPSSGKPGAQGFRGLGLDARVLAASMKYPYKRAGDPRSSQYRKFGYYEDDEAAYNDKVASYITDERPTLEAQIMDWADDITYALHDVEDFYTAGLIPLNSLRTNSTSTPVEPAKFAEFYDYASGRVVGAPGVAREEFLTVAKYFPLSEFDGTNAARARLTRFTSDRITELVTQTSVDSDHNLVRGREGANDALVSLMKQLTWFYVIERPALASAQIGGRKMLRALVLEHIQWASSALAPRDADGKARTDKDLSQGLRQLPPALSEILRNSGATLSWMRDETDATKRTCRAVIDYVASLTEDEVFEASSLLSGVGGVER